MELAFHPFIRLEPIPAKDFRKQKIDIAQFSAVIFTSRNAIDHFFRICEEMKVSVSQDTKYFCITEAVALYLQKFILYRKRKVFYGADGLNKSMFDVINKHKENEKFLYPCSENQQDNGDHQLAQAEQLRFCNSLHVPHHQQRRKDRPRPERIRYHLFLHAQRRKSLFDNCPKFKQNGTKIGAFGSNTSRAVEEAGLTLDIKAPLPRRLPWFPLWRNISRSPARRNSGRPPILR
ncbi:uroporphyrinogen-III synthase [Puia sp. P3]|uniref:uroporphyrinogen-III synthase n=1 Tax=Puia sp. P3 TaxID=3423952 RepID=UPI003D6768FD